MGTHIEAACAQAGNGRRKATARRLANDAARTCFSLAGRRPSDVDMLINVGMYREDNMGEPALAAIIQEDIGANLGHPPTGGSGTFSFDLLNGACGVLTALQIESGLLQSGVIKLGAVVSSDVQPELENPRAHFLRPAGGAMLLKKLRKRLQIQHGRHVMAFLRKISTRPGNPSSEGQCLAGRGPWKSACFRPAK